MCYFEVIKISVDDFMDLKLDEALKLAKKKLKEGSSEEAKCIYQDILRRFPANKKAKGGLKSLSGSPAGKSQNFLDPQQDQQQLLINLYNQGQLQQALDQAKYLLEQFPYSIFLHNICGAVYAALNQYDAAIDCYKQALKIKPDYADAHYNMGVALKKKGKLDAAIESYKQALKIKPDYADAHYNMGFALQEKGELDAAIESYKQALKIKPDYADALSNMGNALQEKGELDAAIESYKQALKIKPDDQAARTLKLHTQAHICDWAAIQADQGLVSKLGTTTQYIDPFSILSLEDAPEHHRLRSELYGKSKLIQKPLPLAPKPLQKPKRLRIGYFSADFKDHPVSHLISKMLEQHNRNHFEIYAYSIGPEKNDNIRQRIVNAVDVFDDVSTMNDRDVALLARQDKIDIAVDLTGYTTNSRSGIFSYRAAPIQINYLGYPGTMGSDSIDYIISDPIVIPNHLQKHYSENIILMPNSYMATDNTRPVSSIPITRLEAGLPEDGFVFCCFNNNYKISPAEFDIWMRLLTRVKGSVLWLRKSNNWSEDNFSKEAQNRGVDSSRLIFAGRKPMDEHLARHKLADLFLDTFAFNAHTTATEALWAGLPVVTKLGKGFAARVAGSLLTAIGLSELITETEQEYEALILDLATNPERLASLKDKLVANRLSKPLFDTELFTKHLEDGYQQAYQRYFEGLEPNTITVRD
jgi:protein O-GlcNAc transferase